MKDAIQVRELKKSYGSHMVLKGIDFQINGANVDIKCMGRTCPIEHQWVHNLLESQHHNSQSETDYYIFCSLDKKESVLQICGYVQKKLVDRCAELHKKGEEVKNDFGHIIKFKITENIQNSPK